MNADDLSPEVRRFVAEHVDSAEQLDILLLLHREPDTRWSVLDVSKAIYTVPASAKMRLEGLVTQGFFTSSGGSEPTYVYQPTSELLRNQVANLAAAYATNRVELIKLIFSTSADAVKSFSEAFRLRGRRD